MMTLTDASSLPTDGSKECKALTAIKLEKGSNTKSPFGKKYTSDSKVCVKYEESKKDYTYSVCLIDEGGNGLSSNDVLNLSKSDVKIGNFFCKADGTGGTGDSGNNGGTGNNVGDPLDWVVSTTINSTGGYTLEKFIGDMENSSSI